MLPTKSSLTQHGDLGGEVVKMQLDSNGLAHIMSVLTDLYSDPEMAVIREYSTNAWDSHVAAGVTRPIEISTPTALNPNFTVKDFGVGLSAEDIRNIYSKYGASTKRETNAQTGMLGLGCKSALTYTHQFLIKAVKDGIKTFVSVSRDADGAGSMSIIEEAPSSEPNGVEIIIPAQPSGSFDFKIRKFFQFWNPKQVLVNGEHPQQIDHIVITDKIWITKELRGVFVVMGGVVYEDPRERYGHYGMIFFADMGEVNFTPSREALHMTSLTIGTIQRFKEELNEQIPIVLSKNIKYCQTKPEALKQYYTWYEYGIDQNLLKKIVFRGEKIVEAVKPLYEIRIDYRTALRECGYASSKQVMSSTIITGFNESSVTKGHRAKIKKFIDERALNPKVLIFDKFPEADWFDVEIFNWEDVKKVKLVYQKREKQPFRIGTGYKKIEIVEDLDKSKEKYYLSLREFNQFEWNVNELLDQNKVDVVIIAPSKVKSFVNKFPHAKHFNVGAKKYIQEYFDTLDKDEHLYYIMGYNEKSILAGLRHKDIDDPDVKSIIQTLDKYDKVHDVKREKKFRMMKSLAGRYGVTVNVPTGPMSKYNLLINELNQVSHVVLYMNAVYNTLLKDKS